MDGFSVGFLLTGLTAFVQLCCNFLTAAYPARPSWLVILVALVSGQAGAFLFAAANQRPFTQQDIAAQLIIIGVFAAAAAAGLNYQSLNAEAKRREATADAPGAPIDRRSA